MNIVGANSMYYFKKIFVSSTDIREVLLLGDAHGSVYFNPQCCNLTKAISKIKKFRVSVNKLFDSLFISKLLFIMLKTAKQNAMGNTDNEAVKYVMDNFKRIIDFDIGYIDEIYNVVFAYEDKNKNLISIIQNTIDKSVAEIKNNVITLTEQITNEPLEKCLLEHEFIYNITKQNDCIDFYCEIGTHDEPYKYGGNNIDYLENDIQLFHALKFLKKYEKETNTNIGNGIYTNVRFHTSDIRLNANPTIEHYKNIFQTIETCTQKIVPEMTEETCKFYVLDYLDNFLKPFFISKQHNELFDLSPTSHKSYMNIFVSFPKSVQNILFVNELYKIYKQYSKSVFSDNDIDVLFKIIKMSFEQLGEFSFVYRGINSLFMRLESVNIKLYTIFRMFIKQNGWLNIKHSIDNGCKNYSYPKNIIGKFGSNHTLFISTFIKYYFALSISKRNDPYFTDADFIAIGSTFEQTATENENRNIRCINVPNNISFFETAFNR